MMVSTATGAFRRYLALLDAIAGVPTAPIGEIVRRSGVSRATAYRLLTELRELGAIQDTPDGLIPGPALSTLARWVRRHDGLRSAASPAMHYLRDATGETVTLHVAAGRDRVCVAQVESQAEEHFAAAVDRPVRLDNGVPGKVLIATLSDTARDQYLDWLATIEDTTAVRLAVDAIRTRGSAIQPIGDFTVAAVPIPGQTACLSVVGPASRWTPAEASAALPVVLAAADRIASTIRALVLAG